MDNAKNIRIVLIITLILNLVISVTKLLIGHFSNSSSIFADGVHSLGDGMNNVIGIVALFFAYEPADKEHPYGHRKIEPILSLFIGFILLLLTLNLIFTSITEFNNHTPIDLTTIELIIMIGTLVVNILVVTYELWAAKKYKSLLLDSDAKHTLSDVVITITVIASMVGIKYFNLPIIVDSIVSLIVAVLIGKIAIEIIKDAGNILTDSKVYNVKEVKNIVYEFDAVKDIHDVKSRGFAQSNFLEMHVKINPDLTVLQANELRNNIISKLKWRYPDDNIEINIKFEPADKKEMRG